MTGSESHRFYLNEETYNQLSRAMGQIGHTCVVIYGRHGSTTISSEVSELVSLGIVQTISPKPKIDMESGIKQPMRYKYPDRNPAHSARVIAARGTVPRNAASKLHCKLRYTK